MRIENEGVASNIQISHWSSTINSDAELKEKWIHSQLKITSLELAYHASYGLQRWKKNIHKKMKKVKSWVKINHEKGSPIRTNVVSSAKFRVDHIKGPSHNK